MKLNLDEIYDLFAWDVSLSEDEYDARVQKGIAEASKLRNIYPFIQPVIAGEKSSKSVWEPCAMVVARKSDKELAVYMHLLLEWLQDMNWPGADIIFYRLFQIPYEEMREDIDFAIFKAKKDKDKHWQNVLEALREHREWE